jgi:signal peptidase I
MTDPAGAPPPPAPAPPSWRSGAASWLLEWLKSIAFALVVWLFLRTFIIEAFRIPSESMENTLLVGDFLFVNKAVYGAEVPFFHWRLPVIREPARGDVVIFDSVEPEQPGMKIVKRVIGLAGDTLAMRAGVLYRNGNALNEPYARHDGEPHSESPEARARMRMWQVAHFVGSDPDHYWPDLNEWGPILVPTDSLFVMGDNRENSLDGRYWGFLPRANVRGTPLFIYYTYDPSTYKAMPYLTNVRWGRIFHVPR